MYPLTCIVTGAESLTDAMVTYQWFKNGVEISSDQTMATIFFQSLVISDGGRYGCWATTTSSLLSGPISSNSTNTVDVKPMMLLCKFHQRHNKFTRLTAHFFKLFVPAVYLSLGGIHVTNNSYIAIYDIGMGDNEALLCVTDLMQCCHSKNTTVGRPLGQWFYPDGRNVPIQASLSDFYRDRGHNIVRLNRRNNASSPTGLYCCEVPDSTFTTHRVCANIGGFVHVFASSKGMFCI